MVQIFDANRKLLVVSDIYPEAVTVKKGDFTIQAMIRHDNTEVLKQMEDMPLIVERHLEKPISVPIYKTILDSTKGSEKITTALELYAGQCSGFVIGPLTEALPKDCTAGVSLFRMTPCW